MKKILLAAVLAGFGMTGYSQYNIDYGIKIGAANYLGEMGGKEKTRRDFIWDMKLGQSATSAGAFIRYKISPLISVNAGFTWGRIKGNDALSTNVGRRARNLSFRNDILDFSVRGEVYIYNVNDVGNKGRYRTDFKSFVFAGVGGFYHSPKASNPEYNGGAWTALRPLQTEGVDYKKFVIGLPVGVGFFFTQKRQHRFGWEIGWHTTFTDYLDDVSTVYTDPSNFDPAVWSAFVSRSDEIDPSLLPEGGLGHYDGVDDPNLGPDKRGDAEHNDTFMFTQFTYSYVIKGPNNFYRQNYSWLSGSRGRRRKVRAKF